MLGPHLADNLFDFTNGVTKTFKCLSETSGAHVFNRTCPTPGRQLVSSDIVLGAAEIYNRRARRSGLANVSQQEE